MFHADDSGRVIHIGANEVRWEHWLQLIRNVTTFKILQSSKYCNPAIQRFHWRVLINSFRIYVIKVCLDCYQLLLRIIKPSEWKRAINLNFFGSIWLSFSNLSRVLRIRGDEEANRCSLHEEFHINVKKLHPDSELSFTSEISMTSSGRRVKKSSSYVEDSVQCDLEVPRYISLGTYFLWYPSLILWSNFTLPIYCLDIWYVLAVSAARRLRGWLGFVCGYCGPPRGRHFERNDLLAQQRDWRDTQKSNIEWTVAGGMQNYF